jgi:ectoine hydroxylase-related dioxygenase (phytanoyl-CoA dioxygenase family)
MMINNTLFFEKEMGMQFTIDQQQIEFFQENGYLIIPNFIDPHLAQAVANRFPKIFRGEFETTVPPDEWRWVEGRDPVDVTRMIWNGWKTDRTIAKLSLHEKVGFFCAKLAHWSGTRLNQDGCLWKPAQSKGLSFHQDVNYIQWIIPHEMVTCWIALDDVVANTGTLEYIPKSHRWGIGQRPTDFHDPEDYQAMARQAAALVNQELKIIPVEIPAGGAAFHHCWLWHGSGPNTSQCDRRALALHCMPESARFHPTNPAFAQGRFRKFDDTTMEESFYPILWSQSGYRSLFIEDYLEGKLFDYKNHTF